MPNAVVGITWKNEDEEARQKFLLFKKGIIDGVKEMQDAVMASGAKSFGDYAKHVDTATAAAKKGNKDIKEGFLSASQAMAEQAKKEADIKKKYEHDAGEAIINDLKRLQDEKKRINNAMLADVTAEAKAELNERKKEITEEIRLLDSEAKEKEKVMKGGIGAKAGIHGTGRQNTEEHGHGGGMMGAIEAVPGVEKLFQGMEKVIDKGKELNEVNESLVIGFKANGSSAEQAEQAFKKNEETVAKLSDTYAISEEKIKNMQAIYLKMGGSQKDLAKNTELMVGIQEKASLAPDMAAKMLAGATNPEIEKGLDKIGLHIDKNASATERQRIISEKLGPTLEAMKDKAQSPMAAFEKFQNIISKLMGTIGLGLIEALGPMLKIIGEVATQMSTVLMPIIEQIMGVIGPILKQLATTVGGILKSVLPIIGELISTLAGPLGDVIKIIINLAVSVLVPLMNAAMTALKPIINVISVVLNSLKPLFTTLGNLAGTMGKMFANSPMIKVLEMVGGIFTKLAAPIGRLVSALVELASTLIEALMPIFMKITDLLDQGMNIVIEQLAAILTEVIEIAVELVTLLAEGLTDAIKWVSEKAEWFSGVFSNLYDIFIEFATWVGGKLFPIFDWLFKAFTWLGEKIVSIANWISGIFKEAWDWLSKAVIWFIDNCINPLNDGFNWAVGILDRVVGAIDDFIGGLFKTTGPLKTLIGWVNSLIGPLKDAIGWMEKLFSGADKAPQKANEIVDATIHIGKAAAENVGEPKKEPVVEEHKEDQGKDRGEEAAKAKAKKEADKKRKADAAASRKAAKDEKKSELDEYKAIQDEYTEISQRAIEKIDLDEANGVIEKEEADKKKLELDISYNAILKSLAENTQGHEKEVMKFELKMAQDRVKLNEAKEKEESKTADKITKLKEDTIKDQERMEKEADKVYDDEQNRKLRMMEDGLDKQLFAEEIAYEKRLRAAEKNADEMKLIELEHQHNVQKIREDSIKNSSLIYKVLFDTINGVATQGLDWLDAGWKKSFHNQQTVLFGMLSTASGAMKGFISDTTKTLLEKGAIWVATNLEVAASSMVSAVAGAIEWINTTFPFPASIGIALGAAGAIFGVYEGVKKAFAPSKKLAQGAVLSEPTFAPGKHQMFEAGEAGPEIVAPFNDFKNMVTSIISNDKNHGELIAVLRDIHKATKEQKTAIVDPWQVHLGVVKSSNEQNSRELS